MASNRLYCALSFACNNNCLHCAVDSERQKHKSLSIEEINILLERIGEIKNVEVEISGGEPTMRPELFYFLEHLTNNYPKVKHVLLTNGRTASNPDITSKLSQYRPYSIFVPLHGDTAQLHDQISQAPGSFDETVLGIHNMYEYKLPVNIKTVVNRLNYQRMPHLVEMIAQKFPECGWIIMNGLEFTGRALANKDMVGIRISDTVPFVENAIDVANKYGMKIVVYSIPPCVLRKEYWRSVGRKKRNYVITKTPNVDMKQVELSYGTVDSCNGCRFIEWCTGAWYSYLNQYGKDEIHPV
jgi:MoaA/NifB/PqqE/SkfB family radical SAM enzyme